MSTEWEETQLHGAATVLLGDACPPGAEPINTERSHTFADDDSDKEADFATAKKNLLRELIGNQTEM